MGGRVRARARGLMSTVPMRRLMLVFHYPNTHHSLHNRSVRHIPSKKDNACVVGGFFGEDAARTLLTYPFGYGLMVLVMRWHRDGGDRVMGLRVRVARLPLGCGSVGGVERSGSPGS